MVPTPMEVLEVVVTTSPTDLGLTPTIIRTDPATTIRMGPATKIRMDPATTIRMGPTTTIRMGPATTTPPTTTTMDPAGRTTTIPTDLATPTPMDLATTTATTTMDPVGTTTTPTARLITRSPTLEVAVTHTDLATIPMGLPTTIHTVPTTRVTIMAPGIIRAADMAAATTTILPEVEDTAPTTRMIRATTKTLMVQAAETMIRRMVEVGTIIILPATG